MEEKDESTFLQIIEVQENGDEVEDYCIERFNDDDL